MYIKEIKIDSFGCLKNKEFALVNGVNVFFGMNESGKSTLFSFILFVFYGTRIKKLPGDISFKDRYMPWDGAPMHGQITFCHGGRTYVITRLCSDTKNLVSVFCESTGEEIKDREILASPGKHYFGISAETFFRSSYITAFQSKYNSMSADEIVSKLTSSWSDVSTEVSYGKISDIINEEISSLNSPKRKNAVIPCLESQIREYKREIQQIDTSISKLNEYKRLSALAQDDINTFEAKLQELKSTDNTSADIDRVGHRSILPLYLMIFLLSCVGVLMGTGSVIFGLSIMTSAAALALCVKEFLSIKRRQRDNERKLFTLKTNNDKIMLLTDDIISARTRKIEYDERYAALKDNLPHKELILAKISDVDKELAEAKERLDALLLCKRALEAAFDEFTSMFSPELSLSAGRILSELTDCRYTKLLVDDSLGLAVDSGYEYKNAFSLSQGACEQAYLALRLALVNILSANEILPVFLDDALAFYDEKRLQKTISLLVDYSNDRQVFFSTCRKSECLFPHDEKTKIFYL